MEEPEVPEHLTLTLTLNPNNQYIVTSAMKATCLLKAVMRPEVTGHSAGGVRDNIPAKMGRYIKPWTLGPCMWKRSISSRYAHKTLTWESHNCTTTTATKTEQDSIHFYQLGDQSCYSCQKVHHQWGASKGSSKKQKKKEQPGHHPHGGRDVWLSDPVVTLIFPDHTQSAKT